MIVRLHMQPELKSRQNARIPLATPLTVADLVWSASHVSNHRIIQRSPVEIWLTMGNLDSQAYLCGNDEHSPHLCAHQSFEQ
jgi:hypothetical protein